MLTRTSLCRQAGCVARAQWHAPATRRSLASPASGSFNYETGTAAGVKYAARDIPGPTAQVALVSQAGTRYETAPGLTLGLQNYAFKVCLRHIPSHHRLFTDDLSGYRQAIKSQNPA